MGYSKWRWNMSFKTTPEQDTAEAAATLKFLKQQLVAHEAAAKPPSPANVTPPPDPNAKK